MNRTLNTIATAVSTFMAMIIAFGLIVAVSPVQAAGFVKYDGINGEAAGDTQEARRLAPRKRVSMAQFRKIMRSAKPSRSASSRLSGRRPTPPPGTPGSFSAGKTGGGTLKGGVSCAGLGLCFCDGAAYCNAFIAVCVEHGGRLSCTEHDSEGRPTSCSCFK